MPTFRELAQTVATESGTSPGDNSGLTYAGASGRMRGFFNWTAEAWRQIQNARTDWLWMQDDFAGTAIEGQQRLTASDLGVTTRFGRWNPVRNPDRQSGFVLTSAGGTSDLIYVPWLDFRARWLRETEPAGMPMWFSIDPQERLVVNCPLDADYTIRGGYVKSLQRLSSDLDVPEMPEDYHDLIVAKALILMATYDEAMVQLAQWTVKETAMMSQLQIAQLPEMTAAGPLA